MKGGNYELAVKLYGEAIALDSGNHVLYSNRSAAYMKMERYTEALSDAEKTIETKKDWAKVREGEEGCGLHESVVLLIKKRCGERERERERERYGGTSIKMQQHYEDVYSTCRE